MSSEVRGRAPLPVPFGPAATGLWKAPLLLPQCAGCCPGISVPCSRTAHECSLWNVPEVIVNHRGWHSRSITGRALSLAPGRAPLLLGLQDLWGPFGPYGPQPVLTTRGPWTADDSRGLRGQCTLPSYLEGKCSAQNATCPAALSSMEHRGIQLSCTSASSHLPSHAWRLDCTVEPDSLLCLTKPGAVWPWSLP